MLTVIDLPLHALSHSIRTKPRDPAKAEQAPAQHIAFSTYGASQLLPTQRRGGWLSVNEETPESPLLDPFLIILLTQGVVRLWHLASSTVTR
jgi:hypothetical protein